MCVLPSREEGTPKLPLAQSSVKSFRWPELPEGWCYTYPGRKQQGQVFEAAQCLKYLQQSQSHPRLWCQESRALTPSWPARMNSRMGVGKKTTRNKTLDLYNSCSWPAHAGGPPCLAGLVESWEIQGLTALGVGVGV